jgi:hypothetical protein
MTLLSALLLALAATPAAPLSAHEQPSHDRPGAVNQHAGAMTMDRATPAATLKLEVRPQSALGAGKTVVVIARLTTIDGGKTTDRCCTCTPWASSRPATPSAEVPGSTSTLRLPSPAS